MASIKELLQAMINKINGKNEGVDWNENDETSPAFVKNRTHYYSGHAYVDINKDIKMVKVSSEIPQYGDTATIWFSSEGKVNVADQIYSTESLVIFGELSCAIALTDNAEFIDGGKPRFIFPERGVYFFGLLDKSLFVSGVSFANADAPEITFDGNIGTIKQLDEKYIPPIPYKKLPLITKNTPGIVDVKSLSEYAPIKVLYKYKGITGLASGISYPLIFVESNSSDDPTSKCYFVLPQFQSIIMSSNKETIYYNGFSFDGYKCRLKFYRTNFEIDRWVFESIENVNSVILPSTTANSTKQFRITVDDSGTISATEVTG